MLARIFILFIAVMLAASSGQAAMSDDFGVSGFWLIGSTMLWCYLIGRLDQTRPGRKAGR